MRQGQAVKLFSGAAPPRPNCLGNSAAGAVKNEEATLVTRADVKSGSGNSYHFTSGTAQSHENTTAGQRLSIKPWVVQTVQLGLCLAYLLVLYQASSSKSVFHGKLMLDGWFFANAQSSKRYLSIAGSVTASHASCSQAGVRWTLPKTAATCKDSTFRAGSER